MRLRNTSLFPLLVIAAIAVTLFSALGIAMMLGYLPSASSADRAGERPAAAQGVAAPRQSGREAAAACPACGVVESIRLVERRGSGSGLGAVAGGLAGMVVGNQFGRGDGRTAMTVLGGVGGAYAGNEIEKNTRRSTGYEVRVRLDQGGVATVHMAGSPAVGVGDKVRVVNGAVVRRN